MRKRRAAVCIVLIIYGCFQAGVLGKFPGAPKYSLRWTDRNPIGSLIIATAATNWITNPRGWLLDPSIDIYTPNGLARFHDRLLAWADRSIGILKDMDAQGMITWDIEGEQFPHPITYVGDPTLCTQLAPEMAGVVDEYFARFRNAGFRVGVTVRPQQFRRTLSGGTQQNVSNPAEQLMRKIGYARQRWGATLFYIDSNGYPGWPLGAEIVTQVARRYPDVLLIPEDKNVFYYAETALYSRLRKGVYSTPGLVRFLYPKAFSVIDTADGAIKDNFSELVAAADRGDILMFRSWFADPANAIVKQICRQARIKAQ